MGLKCLECGSSNLLGIVTIDKTIPLAQKGGSLKMSGEKVTQKEIKQIWDMTHDGDDKKIKGPIMCADCETDHYYLVGGKPSLRMGNYRELENNGFEGIELEG